MSPITKLFPLAAAMACLLLPAAAEAQNRRTQQVSTAQQLVSAIRSGVRIELLPGVYDLTSVPEEKDMNSVRWEIGDTNKSVVVHDVNNLQIVGVGTGNHEIIVSPRDVFVMAFEDCKGVTLENITFGHDPAGGDCFDGVIRATRCQNFTMKACDLFGCGVEGLYLDTVMGFVFEKSTIRDCSGGIMTAKNCTDMKFVKSAFFNNKEVWGFRMTECNRMTMTDCVIAGNVTKEPLFQFENCGLLTMTGGFIIQNDVEKLTNAPASINFVDVNLKNAISPKG